MTLTANYAHTCLPLGTGNLPSLKTNQLPTNEKFVGYDNTFANTSFYLALGGQKAAAFAKAVN